jgi:glycosyltransferase involved in cell wall biosynthesis
MPLNEAAAAGLPLVATEAVGAARELIESARNGFVVPTRDASALQAALERVACDGPFRVEAGQRSRDLASQLTPDRWADAVARLVNDLAD